MRFGLMSLAGTPEDVIADARLAADAGFDVIATADHLRHPRDPQVPGLDGWSILAAWAVTTERLRLAMLVSNLMVVLCSERDTQPVVNTGMSQ